MSKWSDELAAQEVGPRELETLVTDQLEHALEARRRRLKVYESLKNLNDIIGTQYGDRVLYELLQNAHDAHSAGERGAIAVRLIVHSSGSGDLLVANKGRGFSFSNLDAIRNIGTSDKEIGEGIGNKGLGFRSVEALTDDVHVYSQLPGETGARFGGYCFRFATPPEVEERLERLGAPPAMRKAVAAQLPRYLVALPVTEQPREILQLAKKGFATVVALPLRGEEAVKLARAQVEELANPSAPVLLFLERLARVQIDVEEGGETVVKKRLTRKAVVTARSNLLPDVRFERVDLGDGNRYLVARGKLAKDRVLAAVAESIPAAPQLKRWLNWKGDAVVSIAVPYEGAAVSQSRLFNFLPMDSSSPAPVAGYIDAPFFADIDRRSLKPDLPLNRFLLEEAAAVCAAAALEIAKGTLPFSERNLVDLAAWAMPHMPKIVAAFDALHAPLRDAEIWPIVSGGDGRSASFHYLYAWPDIATKLLKPGRLATLADAAILPSSLGQERLRRIGGLASHTGLPLTLGPATVRNWLVASAEKLAAAERPRPGQWADFYDDAVTLYAAANGSLSGLIGAPILIGAGGEIYPARATADADDPPVFVRQSRRGRDRAPAPPSSLARRFRFLRDDVQLSEATLAAFEKAGLLRRYDPLEVLEGLEGALGGAVTNAQRRDTLAWAFGVWRHGGAAAEKALQAARLHVPVLGGWKPGAAATFSSSWTQTGKAVEAYYSDAAAVSPDCAKAKQHLVVPFAQWPVATLGDGKGDWHRFLEKLGVRDGLVPIAGKLRRKGTPNNHWHVAFMIGEPGLGMDKDWVAEAGSPSLAGPYTEHWLDGECWRLPGQLESDSLPASAREILSDLIQSYLGTYGDTHFTMRVRHWKNESEGVTLPTPLAVFLKHGAWAACQRRDETRFKKASESWSSQVPRQLPPRFVDRFSVEQGSRAAAAPLMFDPRIGLREWPSPATAAARLVSLAEALPDSSSAERRDLREQLRRAWADLAEIDTPLPVSPPLVVERFGALEIVAGFATSPPSVFLTNEREGFAARALIDRGEAVVDVGDLNDRQAAILQRLLNETGAYDVKLVDGGSVKLMVDGAEFSADPRDSLLVAGPLEWLADTAMLAHEYLGQSFDLRILPTQLLEQRLRQVRLRMCESFALEVAGQLISAQAHERAQAYSDARAPTLIVADTPSLDMDALIDASTALTKLMGARQNTLEQILSRIQRARGDTSIARPSEEELARAIGRSVEIVREHFDATRGGLERRIRMLLPALSIFGSQDVAEGLRRDHERLGSTLNLRQWLNERIGELEAERLLSATDEAKDQGHMRDLLGLEFAPYNSALLALGYEGLNDERDFERRFEVFRNEHRAGILDRLRRRFHPAYARGEDLAEYAALKELTFLSFNPDWVFTQEQLSDAFLQAHFDNVLTARLGADDGDIILPDMARTVDANVKLVMVRNPDLARLVRAWCRKNQVAPPPLEPADAKVAVRALDKAGLLDFELLNEAQLPRLLAAVSLWPQGMIQTLALDALKLTEDDLEFEEREARERRQQAEIARRSIIFAGNFLDTGAADFDRRFMELAEAALAQSDEWWTRSRPQRLLAQEQRAPHERRGGGRGGGGRGKRPEQPPEVIRQAMGRASEYLARAYLRNRHPNEMNDECWVSTNRANYCTGPDGDDGLGYDFRVVTERHEWLYEVKSALDGGGEFELTAREIEVAGSAAADNKRRYRILYVPYVFDPTNWCVWPLQNPVGQATRDRFRVVRSGSVRYAFERR